MKTIKVGQRVAFSQSIIRRISDASAMRGIVLSVRDKCAEVDCMGTWSSDEGRAIRWIPIANLTPILSNGAIFGD